MNSEASYYFGKVVAQITPSHRLEAFWQRDHSPENFVGPNSGGDSTTAISAGSPPVCGWHPSGADR